jgi:hypothetical protein
MLPTKCTECSCLEKDQKGNFVVLTEGGIELYVCNLKGRNASIAKTLAETQAVCCEEP